MEKRIAKLKQTIIFRKACLKRNEMELADLEKKVSEIK
jgi:hypothetical protein